MPHRKDTPIHVGAESIINVLGVTYVHAKSSDGGDLYLTRCGLPFADILDIHNWYEPGWFEQHRVRLLGTSAVYRVPTKQIGGRMLELVVKNCRVGEDVPLDTHTLEEFLSAEFNSPWEEFALVMEMREGHHGPRELTIRTQEPLAIYVPPAKMQPWQSGRSAQRINRIKARHPGIDLDILRQYKLIYRWIDGLDIVQLLSRFGLSTRRIQRYVAPMNRRAMRDLDRKGYVVADMKPEHIIIDQDNVDRAREIGKTVDHHPERRQADHVQKLIKRRDYSVIDYELLLRTPRHEEEVRASRRHTYLDDQRDRLVPTELPEHLHATEILGVPYICGHAESTGGYLWVVGKNARLFDYFLPERWRRADGLRLSHRSEIFYTHTKDNVHLVWKTSRIGETPTGITDENLLRRARRGGYNSPFEEASIAQALSAGGVGTVYMRAIYRTGSAKIERSIDERRYATHADLLSAEGGPVLEQGHNYVSIRGYYNGPDTWVAVRKGPLMRPIDARRALARGLIDEQEFNRLFDSVRAKMKNAGFDGSLLDGNDLLLAIDPSSGLVRDSRGLPEARISNLELVYKL